MAVQAAQLVATVQIEGADTAQTQLKDVGKSVDSLAGPGGSGGGFGSLLKQGLGLAAGFAVFNVGAKAVGFLKDQFADTLQVAIAHQQIMTQTAQVIKSTGDASGLTAQQIGDMADSLSKVTPFSNDTIQSGENMMLTFTHIGKDVFPDATNAMLDMAQAMHIGPEQAAMQLGKALDDPKTGLTALTREGVKFSDQEKEQIKTMLAHNDVAGAQKLMLKELQTEFGGSAEAAGKTFGGQLEILKNHLQDVKEKLGTALLPILSQFTGWIGSTAMPLLDKFGDWFSNTAVPAIQGFGDSISKVFNSGPAKAMEQALGFMGSQLKDLFGTLGKVAGMILGQFSGSFDSAKGKISGFAQGAFGGLINTIGDINNHISQFTHTLNQMDFGEKIDAVKQFGSSLATQLGPPLQNIGNLLKGELGKELKDLGKDAKQVGDWFMSSVVPAIKQAWPGFKNLGEVILNDVVPAVIKIRGIFVDVIQHAFEKFAPIIEKIVPPLIKFAGILANDVANGLKFIMPYVLQAAKAIGDFAEGIMDRVAPIITKFIDGIKPILQDLFKFWNAVWPGMKEVLQGVWNEIVGVFKIAWAIVTGIFNVALDLLSGNWGQAWTDMKNMLGGIWDGIKTMVGGAIQALGGILTAIGGIVNTYLVKPFQDALGSIGGVFNAIGKLVSDASTLNFGAIPGDLHTLGIPGFAQGTSYAPGGWAMVGEQGPEAMYVPRGAQIVPNNQLGSLSSSQGEGGQPLVINVNIAGQNVAQVLMPSITNAIRYGVGGLGM